MFENLQQEVWDSHAAHKLELQGRISFKVITIREVEVIHLTWSLGEEEWEYEELHQQFAVWKQAVRTHLVEFLAEEHSAFFRDFCECSSREQDGLISDYLALGDHEKENNSYVQNLYRLRG